MGVPAMVVVAGAGTGRCCWTAAQGGGAEQGSALGMSRLKKSQMSNGRTKVEAVAKRGGSRARAREHNACIPSSYAVGIGTPAPQSTPAAKPTPRPCQGRPCLQTCCANMSKNP